MSKDGLVESLSLFLKQINNCCPTQNKKINILVFCFIGYDNLNHPLLAYEDNLTHLFTLNDQVKNVCKSILSSLTISLY